MIVTSLEIKNFRNYEELSLDLMEGTNIFYGNNAQGKTNILESLYVSGTTKSHKSSKDQELILFGENEAHIKTRIKKNEKEYQIDIHLKKNRPKGIAINQIPIKKASDLFGILNLILFSPEDLNIIKNGPAQRRRFIDLELCQLDKIYLYDLTNYNKTLNQRNKLLKDIFYHPELADTLPMWDVQLKKYGRKVIKRRKQFIRELDEIVKEIHKNISGEREKIELSYEPDTDGDFYDEEFLKFREKDLKTGTTNKGPHRDDLSINVNGVDLRKYGSQGQQRTCALSLKLSEIELVKRAIHDKPVLLLDDVLSELDNDRQNYLLNSIHDIQTLITCTGLDEFVKNRFQIDKVFEVVNGHVYEKNE